MVRRQFRDVRGGQGAPPGRRRDAAASRQLQEADALTGWDLLAGLRAADHDRYLATLWSPAAARPALAAAHLFDLELARVAVDAREPMLAAIKIAWWRERLEAIAAGGEPPAQPLLRAIAAERGRFDVRALATLEEAWLPLLEERAPDWAAHARARGAALFGVLAHVLGGDAVDAAAAGGAWAAGQVARGGLGVAAEGAVLDSLERFVPPARMPKALRPLLGLARLGARDVERARQGMPPQPAGTMGRQWVLARAMLLG